MPGVLLLAIACGRAPVLGPTPTLALQAPDSVALRVYLIGDAGAPHPGFEPVLAALAADAGRRPDRSWVVFLGDNLYPRGLPDSADGERAEAERRLAAQVAAVVDVGARGFFVPGNHDWAKGGDEGWERIRRQGRFVARASGGRMRVLPADGCPGPAARDLEPGIRLVLLDTQWWLHDGPRPLDPDTTCPAADSPGEVTDSLRTVLAGAGGRHVIVTGHHPMLSGGVHGGTFRFLEHIFPLRDLHKALWVPLPLLGSLYPIARRNGITDQDLSGDRNRAMRDSLTAAFAAGPPLVYAAGHDHHLEVLGGGATGARYVLVSGGGIYGHDSRVSNRPTQRFRASAAGYMRLDVTDEGRVWISVVVVDAAGAAIEPFGMWLE